jgi:four helix bundle protein
MATGMEDLRVLQAAERVTDDIWNAVSTWDEFARDTIGKQLVRAVDSIGANVAESFGRYAYGEKLQFLFYARGSLFETKYWLNRAFKRNLLTMDMHQQYASLLTEIAKQINVFARSLRAQRHVKPKNGNTSVYEPIASYIIEPFETDSVLLFDESNLAWLAASED